MNALRFKKSALQPLIEHAKNAPEHTTDYSLEQIGPGLFLVKDQGVYLMSNGEPALKDESGKRHRVVYAEGLDPHKDEDWYDLALALCGGDDFGELIPMATIEAALAQGDTLEITLTAQDIRCAGTN